MASTGPARRGRGRPPIHDEGRLLDAAARALIRRGYSGLRYSDVSEESGVPVPSLQNRFVTLDALRRTALRRKVRLELEELVSGLRDVADPWGWVVAMIERSVALDADLRRAGWTLWVEYQHAAAYDAELASDADLVDAQWLGVLAEKIAWGTREGAFVPVLPARESARLLQAMIDGLGYGLAAPRSDAYAREVIDLLIDGARALLRPQA